MERLMEKGESVHVMNCDVKKSRTGAEYELVMSTKSDVAQSPKKFKIDENEMLGKVSKAKMVELQKLECIQDLAVNSAPMCS